MSITDYLSATDMLSILPMAVLVLWACALLLVEAFVKSAKKYVPLLAAIGLAVSLGFFKNLFSSNSIGFLKSTSTDLNDFIFKASFNI